MTAMLASVRSKEEALLVLTAKVDMIDLKQPALGALGALKPNVITDIVQSINGKCPVSATIGDLAMHTDLVFNAVETIAATGVNYVKIGVFPEGDSLATINKLAELKNSDLSLIAVLFADSLPCLSIIKRLKIAGFKGVMLDTMNKQRSSLTQMMNFEQIAGFVTQVKQQFLLCGLAGSLTEADIKTLLALNPDYLGFRSALCQQHDRVGQLDQQAIIKIQKTIHADVDSS